MNNMTYEAWRLTFQSSEQAARAAFNALSALSPAGAVRYCPECGHIGDPEAGHRDCCPDGARRCYVPEAVAKQARRCLLAAINPHPREAEILRSHGDWCDAQARSDWNGRTAGDMARHHAEIVEALAPTAAKAEQGEEGK